MTNDIAPRPTGASTPAINSGGVNLARFSELLAKPSELVPPEVRPALLECWMAHKTLKDMETSMPIAILIGVWITRHGLLPEDATTILLQMQSPKVLGTHNFANELTADLARRAAEKIELRGMEKYRREMAEQRRVDLQNAAPPEEIAAVWAKMRADMAANIKSAS